MYSQATAQKHQQKRSTIKKQGMTAITTKTPKQMEREEVTLKADLFFFGA